MYLYPLPAARAHSPRAKKPAPEPATPLAVGPLTPLAPGCARSPQGGSEVSASLVNLTTYTPTDNWFKYAAQVSAPVTLDADQPILLEAAHCNTASAGGLQVRCALRAAQHTGRRPCPPPSFPGFCRGWASFCPAGGDTAVQAANASITNERPCADNRCALALSPAQVGVSMPSAEPKPNSIPEVQRVTISSVQRVRQVTLKYRYGAGASTIKSVAVTTDDLAKFNNPRIGVRVSIGGVNVTVPVTWTAAEMTAAFRSALGGAFAATPTSFGVMKSRFGSVLTLSLGATFAFVVDVPSLVWLPSAATTFTPAACTYAYPLGAPAGGAPAPTAEPDATTTMA